MAGKWIQITIGLNTESEYRYSALVETQIAGDMYRCRGSGKTKDEALLSAQFNGVVRWGWDPNWLEQYYRFADIQEPLL